MKAFAVSTFLGMIPMTFVFDKLGRELFEGEFLQVMFGLLIIAGMFLVPWAVAKFNLSGL